MGLIARALRLDNVAPNVTFDVPRRSIFNQESGSYERHARAYSANEIIYAAIELLASSAGEPHICGRRWRRNSPTYANPRSAIRNELVSMRARGIPAPNATLIRNGYVEELPDHPLVELLNNPNPFMSRGQFWGTAVMDRALAGNFYALKGRSNQFPSSFPLELWRLRPDKVTIIPSPTNFIEAYEYDRGNGQKERFSPRDIIHWKTRNPYNDYYGMPPMLPLMGRVTIDEYMESFLRNFFERGGTGPGAILSVNKRMSQEDKDFVRDRLKRQFNSANGSEWLILDQTESSYQQLGLDRGLRDALPKELDAVTEARIAMVFGIPGSILGLLIGYESSSYANKRQDWQVFWDLTMTPMLSDLDDALNLSMGLAPNKQPEFTGIDQIYFDLDDIRALQEDTDKLQERARKNWESGLTSFEETRDAIGLNPDVDDGLFRVPANVKVTPFEELGETPEPPEPVEEPEPMMMPEMPQTQNTLAEARCGQCNRLLGRDVSAARFDCPRCKFVTAFQYGQMVVCLKPEQPVPS